MEERGQTKKMQTNWHKFISEIRRNILIDVSKGSIPYAKQLDLRQTFPHIMIDLPIASLFPPHTFLTTYLWVGPSGAVTGLHNDDEHNYLVQVHGSKRVLLFPPSAQRFLSVNSKYDSGTLCCDTPVEQVHPTAFLSRAHDVWAGRGRLAEISALLTCSSTRTGQPLSIGLFADVLSVYARSLSWRRGMCCTYPGIGLSPPMPV